MSLKNNPFYLLRVSCSATRREILSAAEEMSFLLDSTICSDAQNALVNPNKRLAAEMDWFIDVNSEIVKKIQTCIDNGTPISTDGLNSLSKLNATIYNLSLLDNHDPFEIGFYILDLDEQFSLLEAEDITNRINQNRSSAKLSDVQLYDVMSQLGRIREEIRQSVSEKLSGIDQEYYTELVTMLAEKCIDDDAYNDGMILSDVVDQYEIKYQSVIEHSTEQIEEHIE